MRKVINLAWVLALAHTLPKGDPVRAEAEQEVERRLRADFERRLANAKQSRLKAVS